MSATENVTTRAKILEALGSYQKQGAVSVDADEMIAMLQDESDRGVVVILVSMLEDILLTRLLRSFKNLTPSEVKNLTRAGGLLCNFDDRINLARALGVIDQDILEMLQVLKALRNACAHSRKEITFLTKEVKDALSLLFDGEGVKDILSSETAIVLRLAFMCAFAYVSEMIFGNGHEHAQKVAQSIMDEARREVQREIDKRRA